MSDIQTTVVQNDVVITTTIDEDNTIASNILSFGITAESIGLGNVDNTTDADKPISTATQAALDTKQPVGNYSTGGGTAIGTNTGDQDLSAYALTSTLSTVGTSGNYNDLNNLPTLGSAAAAQIEDFATALQSDDNYVTNEEKIVLGNTSGTNTGDQDLSSFATTENLEQAALQLETSLGGAVFNVVSPENGDVLQYFTNEWVNSKQELLTDGGNF